MLYVSLFFPPYELFTQNYQLNFRKLTVDNGLSQNTVQAIIQDKKGFMWFGTQDGLNRYDGYEFRVFRNNTSDNNSLSNNYVWDIFEDSGGTIWIATFGGGLNYYDPETERIGKFSVDTDSENSLSSNRIFCITEYPPGIIWAGTNDGLNRIDKISGKVTAFFVKSERNDELPGNYIGSVANSNDGSIWISGDIGLIRFNARENTYENIQDSHLPGGIDYTRASNLVFHNNRLYLTCSSGIVSIDTENNKDSTLIRLQEFQTSKGTPEFGSLMIDDDSHFWAGTPEGLYYIDLNKGIKKLYTNQKNDPNSLSYNSVTSLYRSGEGVLWVGTKNGLNIVYNTEPQFRSSKTFYGNSDEIDQNTHSILEDKNGIIWQGSSKGINLFKPEVGLIQELNYSLKDNLISHDYILSLIQISNGTILAGTRGNGLIRIDMLNGSFPYKIKAEKVLLKSVNIEKLSIHCIYQTVDGNIWLGTGGAGLIMYDPESKLGKHYFKGEKNKTPSHPYIYSILEDSFGNIWLGTASGGLNLFDQVSERFMIFQNDPVNEFSLSNNVILSLLEDNKGNLWAGTSAGLNKFTIPLKKGMINQFTIDADVMKDSLFMKYGRKNGFSNDVIYGILQDISGELWLSTNNGLIRFNPSSGTVLKNYDKSEGLLNIEYNQNAFCKTRSGELFFGGVNGMNYFDPNELDKNVTAPGVEITGLRLYNERNVGLVIRKYDFILQKSISYLKDIELKYYHKVVTFEFAALGYNNPEKNNYKYMLEGFDDDWVTADHSRTATYTNLDAGEYKFRVIAANNDGVWNTDGAYVKLVVKPAPWLSWYAYIFYALCLVFAGYIFIRQRVKKATKELEVRSRIEKAKVEERERFRKEASRDFHDEAGNKLTRINLYTELAKMNSGNENTVDEYLLKIEQSSGELSSGMRDFIWAMDPDKDTLFDTVLRLKDFGDDLLISSGVNFNVSHYDGKMPQIILPMDVRRAITLIFKEAMNNCCKHSFAKNVNLSVEINEGLLEIKLVDDGKGFAPAEDRLAKGYGLKNMKGRAAKCDAELFVTASEGHGTEICFKFKIQHMGN